jgi:hypothetical protein
MHFTEMGRLMRHFNPLRRDPRRRTAFRHLLDVD